MIKITPNQSKVLNLLKEVKSVQDSIFESTKNTNTYPLIISTLEDMYVELSEQLALDIGHQIIEKELANAG